MSMTLETGVGDLIYCDLVRTCARFRVSGINKGSKGGTSPVALSKFQGVYAP